MNESRKVNHTVRVATEMHRFGDGLKMEEPQGFNVEFFKRGEYVGNRSYSYNDADQATMFKRITEWVRSGTIS